MDPIPVERLMMSFEEFMAEQAKLPPTVWPECTKGSEAASQLKAEREALRAGLRERERRVIVEDRRAAEPPFPPELEEFLAAMPPCGVERATMRHRALVEWNKRNAKKKPPAVCASPLPSEGQSFAPEAAEFHPPDVKAPSEAPPVSLPVDGIFSSILDDLKAMRVIGDDDTSEDKENDKEKSPPTDES